MIAYFILFALKVSTFSAHPNPPVSAAAARRSAHRPLYRQRQSGSHWRGGIRPLAATKCKATDALLGAVAGGEPSWRLPMPVWWLRHRRCVVTVSVSPGPGAGAVSPGSLLPRVISAV